jgi:hypothetical protein
MIMALTMRLMVIPVTVTFLTLAGMPIKEQRGKPHQPPAQPLPGRTQGTLAEGDITAAQLFGPLAGQPLSALLAAIEAGSVYVNVHTNDFVDPPNTGPGDFPGGEIRGQLQQNH